MNEMTEGPEICTDSVGSCFQSVKLKQFIHNVAHSNIRGDGSKNIPARWEKKLSAGPQRQVGGKAYHQGLRGADRLSGRRLAYRSVA
jgi:hypothetical protein